MVGGTLASERSSVLGQARGQGRPTDKLTDRQVRAFIAQVRLGTAPRRKLSDGGGLYLTLTPNGSPVWRVKYRWQRKERVYSAGPYPGVSLDGARAERESVKSMLRQGRDPNVQKRINRLTAEANTNSTFGGVAEDWLELRKSDWSIVHQEKTGQQLRRDVLPKLGKLPIGEITPAIIAHVVQAVADRGATETAGKVLWNISGIFRLAQARGLCENNPAIPVREILPKRKQHTQRPALLDLPSLGDLLRRAEAAPISPSVRLAHRLAAFTVQRLGNVIAAEWNQFHLDGDMPEWTIPRAKMKVQSRHHAQRVLLGPTIASEFRTWKSITGGKGYVFPSPSGRKHVTHESVEKVYRVTLGMDGKHAPHGWRASLASLARDAGFSKDVVDMTLDHIHDTEVARAYDRGERLEERKKLVAWWDAQLTAAQAKAKAKPLHVRKSGTV